MHRQPELCIRLLLYVRRRARVARIMHQRQLLSVLHGLETRKIQSVRIQILIFVVGGPRTRTKKGDVLTSDGANTRSRVEIRIERWGDTERSTV